MSGEALSQQEKRAENGSEDKDRRPWLVAVMCLVTFLIPAYTVLPGPLKSNGSPARLLGFAFFLLVILGFVASRPDKARGRAKPNPGTILIILFFFIELLLYAIGCQDLKDAVVRASMTRALLSLVAQIGIALFIISTVRTPRQRAFGAGALVLALTWTCTVALLQNFRIADLKFSFVPPGLVVNADDVAVAARGGALRAIGTSAHPIELAVVAAVAVLMAFHFARYAIRPLHRQLATIACILAFLAVPAAVSRSGVVVLATGFMVYVLAVRIRTLGNVVIVAMIGLLAQKLVSPSSINALWSTITNSKQDDSVTARTDDYAAVSQVFHEHPWFGLGLGGYPPEIRVLDNQWLQALVTGGVLGVAAMILLLMAGICGMTWSLREANTAGERDLVYALGASFVGIFASCFTFDLFSFQQATFLLLIIYGLLWSGTSTCSTGIDQHHAATEFVGHGQRGIIPST